MDKVDAILLESFEELKRKQQANTEAWGLGHTDRRDVDFDTGFLKFSNTDGFTVTAPVQVIGTFDTDDSTFLWAWDHPSIPAPLARTSLLIQDFGDLHQLVRFTTRLIRCTEDEAWHFTALGLRLSGAAGSYRGRSGSAYVYMTFGEVTIRQVH
jgi:hypothetical protein